MTLYVDTPTFDRHALRDAILRRYDAFDADLLARPERTPDERQDAWRALLAALDEPLRALEGTDAQCQRHALNRLLKLEGARFCKTCQAVKPLDAFYTYWQWGRLYHRTDCAACCIALMVERDAAHHRAYRARIKRQTFAAILGVQP